MTKQEKREIKEEKWEQSRRNRYRTVLKSGEREVEKGMEPGRTTSDEHDNQENDARGDAPESFFSLSLSLSSAKPSRGNERGYAVAGGEGC